MNRKSDHNIFESPLFVFIILHDYISRCPRSLWLAILLPRTQVGVADCLRLFCGYLSYSCATLCRLALVAMPVSEYSKKFRNFVFTWNNYSAETEAYLAELPCRYVIYGKEVAPLSGTPHLQGYIVFSAPYTKKTVQTKLRGAHVEPALGSVARNVEYCSKSGDVVERGDKPVARKDFAPDNCVAWEQYMAIAKKGDLERLPPAVYMRHKRAFHEVAVKHSKPPMDLDKCCVFWVYGPPGSGKSYGVRKLIDSEFLYYKNSNKWWDGYDQSRHEYVLMEDVDENAKCLSHHMKLWFDRYSFLAETKGSAQRIRPRVIVVTSNYAPDRIFGEDPVLLSAIKRRIQLVDVKHTGRQWYRVLAKYVSAKHAPPNELCLAVDVANPVVIDDNGNVVKKARTSRSVTPVNTPVESQESSANTCETPYGSAMDKFLHNAMKYSSSVPDVVIDDMLECPTQCIERRYPIVNPK